jgi:hypothetical protein
MYFKSQLLLGGSVILAIAFVGCVFEISSGAPQWGEALTWGILLASFPVGVALFLNAVKMARMAIGSDRQD